MVYACVPQGGTPGFRHVFAGGGPRRSILFTSLGVVSALNIHVLGLYTYFTFFFGIFGPEVVDGPSAVMVACGWMALAIDLILAVWYCYDRQSLLKHWMTVRSSST